MGDEMMLLVKCCGNTSSKAFDKVLENVDLDFNVCSSGCRRICRERDADY